MMRMKSLPGGWGAVVTCIALGCGSGDGESGSTGMGPSGTGGSGAGGMGAVGGAGGVGGVGGTGAAGGAGGSIPPSGWQLDTSYGDVGFATVGRGTAEDEIIAAVVDDSDRVVFAGVVPGTLRSVLVGRVNAAGDVDTAFGDNGTVVIPIGLRSEARGVAVQADGKIVVSADARVGDQDVVAVLRMNEDGSLDSSFGDANGIALADANLVGAVAVNADGTIVVGTKTGTSPQVLRLTAAGVLDIGFGTGGIVDIPNTSVTYEAPADFAPLSDGSLLVLASRTSQFTLTRLTPNGQLDSNFGNMGQVQMTETMSAMSLVGSSVVLAGNELLRFDLMGVEDTTFTPPTTLSHFVDVEQRANGSVVALEEGLISSYMVGFTAAGDVDTSYGGGDGIGDDVFSSVAWAALVSRSDGTDVAVSSTNTIYASRVRRFDAVGNLDATFGASEIESNKPVDELWDAELAPDGSLVVMGFQDGDELPYVARLSASGQHDTAFGAGGFVTLNTASFNDMGAIAVQSDGAILVGVAAIVRRFFADGSQDDTYGGSGTGVLSGAFDIADMRVDASGRLVAAVRSGPGLEVHRLDTAGGPDSAFGGDGSVLVDALPGAVPLSLDDQGRILVATLPQNFIVPSDLFRLLDDGSFDPAFGAVGVTTLDMHAQQILVDGTTVYAVGNRACASGCERETVVTRLLENGAPDPAFADDGTFAAAQSNHAPIRSQGSFSLLRDRGVVLARIDDGLLLADAVLIDGHESVRVVRLSLDGVLDPLFGDGGSLVLNNTPIGYWEPRMAIAPDLGQMLIAGQGFSPGGGTDIGVLRLVEVLP